MELVRGAHGWSLLDGEREHVTEGDTPRACKRCHLPVFLDTHYDISFCAFCNAWVGGSPSPTCPPSARCSFCEAMRAAPVRASPLSRPLTDEDALVAEFLREVIPTRLLDP
jgi:hypothetical protein